MDKQKQRLNQLNTDIKAKNAEVQAIFAAADKRDGKETQEEKDQIKRINKEIEDLLVERDDLGEMLGIRDAAAKRHADLNEPAGNLPFHGGTDGSFQGDTFKSIGEDVLSNEEMSAWLKRICPNGAPPSQRIKIDSPPVQVKTLITGASSTSAGPLVNQDRKPIVDPGTFQRPLTIRDIITVGETGSDTVEYVRVNSFTNNAAPVAEATGAGDGSGVKPESALGLVLVTETVKTIAHWIPATNRALTDAAQLRTLIDNFLRYGLDEEVEDQIINGDGTGQNFTGVLNVSGTASQAWDTNILKTTRKARTKVRTEGRTNPTAYVLHPLDWEKIDLEQDGENRYYFGGPMQMGTPRLWGLPVVESEGMPEGTGMVANWKMAVLWDRMQAAISMTNSHSDFFVRNLIAILAELRAAFGVLRTKAFVEIDTAA